MKRGRSTNAPTKSQQRYQDNARALGCVVCLYLVSIGWKLPSQCGMTRIHHRNRGDLHGAPRLGQGFVVAMGDWHHQGIPLPGMQADSMREIFGPSFEVQCREFRAWTAEFFPAGERGTGAWQQLQDELLAMQSRVTT